MNDSRITRPGTHAALARQRGMTLVELMVALVLGLLIAGAAVATLIVARRGFTSVDNGAQLRENARFAATLIQRIVAESGFENAAYGQFLSHKLPGIRGYNNSLVSAAAAGSLPDGLAHDTRTGPNGSDVLVVRFSGAGPSGGADGSMINCAGIPEPESNSSGGADPRAVSIFHIATGSTAESATAEPSLVCTYRVPNTSTFNTVPLVQGVEAMQVLYGTFGVTKSQCAATLPTSNDYSPGSDRNEFAAEQYLTAKEMDGPSGYCENNWARLRSLRIGLLVRGAVNDVVVNQTKDWNLLGAPGASFGPIPRPTTDIGSNLTTSADGRLRQQLVFTVHLRNQQFTNQSAP